MAKILITSIGTGRLINKNRNEGYQKENYYVGDKSNSFSTPYLFTAMKHFYKIEKCVFLGTCGSDWLSLYEYLHCENLLAKPYDEEYSIKLMELFEQSEKYKIDTEKTKELLQPLKEAMGEFCLDIIVLKYGLNNDELLTNFSLISGISSFVSNGDSIYLDITHSFRSLPVYQLLTVSYLKDALKKDIRIEMVSYAMREISGDNDNCSPIVDLTQLVNILDWIKATEEFEKFGTAYFLSDLLDKDLISLNLTREMRKALNRLNDSISVNNFDDFKSLIRKCKKITELNSKKGFQTENIVLDKIFAELADRFGDLLDDDFNLRLALAKWHFEKKRYFASAVTIIESIITFCAELTGTNSRNEVRTMLHNLDSHNSTVKQFVSRYHDMRKIRNDLAHAEALKSEDLERFEGHTKYFYSVYNNQFKDNDENLKELKNALLKASGSNSYHEDII